jgi:acyl-homoserine lactone acylase PvdQ
VFGISQAARRRFAVGPLPRPASDDQPFRARLDPRAWDSSRVMNAPGQSESPDSPHYADLAALWSTGQMVPLFFTEAAIAANAASTLTLVPPASGRPPKP